MPPDDNASGVAIARAQAGAPPIQAAARAPGLTSINQSMLGSTGGDPFKGDINTFPRDLTMNNNWVEFVAKPTKGAAEDFIGGFLGGISSVVGTGGTIRLPLPANLSTDYNPSYTTPDLSLGVGSALKAFDRGIYNNQDIPGQAATGASLAGAGISAGAALAAKTGAGAGLTAAGAALGVGGNELAAALKVFGGVAQNPHKIVLFTGVDFRDHTFSWKLSPRNREESDSIRRIIEMFVYYSHPEFVAGGLFFKYPEFFEIKFARDSYLFRLRPSVCTDIKVDYHSQGYAAYIRNADGSGEPAPAEVSLSLTFKETEVISKQFLNPSPVAPAAVREPPYVNPQPRGTMALPDAAGNAVDRAQPPVPLDQRPRTPVPTTGRNPVLPNY